MKKVLKHWYMSTVIGLEIDTLERKIFVSGCVKDDLSQKWTLENLDEETLAKWNDL